MNERLARTLLEKQGHTVMVAHNGREAPALVQEKGFDVVLMDVQMPEMDGLAATRAIREIESANGGHVGLTAHAMKGDRERCFAAGMDGYVPKPIRLAVLFAAIEQVIAQRTGAEHPETADQVTGVLDEEGLVGLASSDGGLLRELAHLFLEDGPQRLAEIGAALESGDLSLLQIAAQTLNGSAGSLCGGSTADAALRLERLAEKGDLAQARLVYPALREEVSRLQQALTRLAGKYNGHGLHPR